MAARRALVIASYQYADGGLRQLIAPAHDAEAFAAVLKDPEIAGFDVTTLINEPSHIVGEAIADFYNRGRGEDLTLLYFTGHGLKDDEGRLYLAMTNTRRQALMWTAISAAQLNEAMEASPSRRKVLILDCCYSGAFPAGRATKADEGVQTLERFHGKGRAVLTASDATQYAFEGDNLRGSGTSSVFTRYLVEAMRSGEADLDNDGDIALDELYSYVHDRVVADMPQQRPKKQEDVDGRILIARNMHWRLPSHLRYAIDSPIARQRLAAVEGLAHLHRVGNNVVRAAVAEHLTTLMDDDSRSVSAAASGLLQRIRGVPPAAAREAEERAAREAEERAARKEAEKRVARRSEDRLRQEAEKRKAPGQAKTSDSKSAAAELPKTEQPTQRDKIIGAPPQLVPAPAHPGPATSLGLKTLSSHPKRKAFILGAVAVILVGVGVGVLNVVFHSAPARPELIQTLTGHTEGVEAVAVTPDGEQIVSGSNDDTMRVWDLATGETLQTLTGHTGSVRAVAVTPDGEQIVSGGSDGTVRVWDLATGETLQTLTGHTEGVEAVAVTPGGQQIVSGGSDGTVRVWDLATGETLQTLTGHTEGVEAVAVTPGGQQIVSGGSDGTVRVWDLATGETLRALTGDTYNVRAVAVTPGGQQIVSGGSDGTVQVRDLATGETLQTLTGHYGSVRAVAVTPDGEQIVSGGNDDTVRVWDLATGEMVWTLTGHTNNVEAVAVTPDGRRIVSGSHDDTVRVWS
ncbi:caspase family protein [Geodermatophilus sp. SYSU D00779]